jgi:hypothetical protein
MAGLPRRRLARTIKLRMVGPATFDELAAGLGYDHSQLTDIEQAALRIAHRDLARYPAIFIDGHGRLHHLGHAHANGHGDEDEEGEVGGQR